MYDLQEHNYYKKELQLKTDLEYFGYYDDMFPELNLPSRELEELEYDDIIMGSEYFITRVLENYWELAANNVGGAAYFPPDLEFLEGMMVDEYQSAMWENAEAEEYDDDGDWDKRCELFDERIDMMMKDYNAYIEPELTARICEVLDTAGFAYTFRDITVNRQGFVTDYIKVENSSAQPIFDFTFENPYIYKGTGGSYERDTEEGYSNLLRMYMA